MRNRHCNVKKGLIVGMKIERKEPTVLRLPPCHPCYGCYLYNKFNGVLFCPYPHCMRQEMDKIYLKKPNDAERPRA